MITIKEAKYSTTLLRHKPLKNMGGDPVLELTSQKFPVNQLSRIMVGPPDSQPEDFQAAEIRLFPVHADLKSNKDVTIISYESSEIWQSGFGLKSTQPDFIMPANWVYGRRQEGQLVQWKEEGGGTFYIGASADFVFKPHKWYTPVILDVRGQDVSNGLVIIYQTEKQDIGTIYFRSSRSPNPVLRPSYYFYSNEDYNWVDATSDREIVDIRNYLVDIKNIDKEYTRKSKTRFDLHLSPKLYSRDWTTSVWKQQKLSLCLKENHEATFAIWDATEIQQFQIIPHHSEYSKLSCDGTSCYFNLDMSNFHQNRYYYIEIKVGDYYFPIQKYFQVK